MLFLKDLEKIYSTNNLMPYKPQLRKNIPAEPFTKSGRLLLILLTDEHIEEKPDLVVDTREFNPSTPQLISYLR